MKLAKRGSRFFFVSDEPDELGRTATLWHYRIQDEETGKPHSVGFSEPGFESREAARTWAESLVHAANEVQP